MATPESKAQFVEWLRRTNPQAYAKILAQRPDLLGKGNTYDQSGRMAGLGDALTDAYNQFIATESANPPTEAAATSWYTDLAKSLSSVLTPVTGAYQSYQLAQINLQRAQHGLPPLDTSQFAPSVTVHTPALASLGKYLLIGFGVLSVVMIAGKRRG